MSTTPTDYGEQVKLWLFAGLTAADLDAARDVLAAACWAAEIRVIPGIRHAHLVTLQVIRNRNSEPMEPDISRTERSSRLAPDAWPSPRRVADEGLGDAEERDTASWPWAEAG